MLKKDFVKKKQQDLFKNGLSIGLKKNLISVFQLKILHVLIVYMRKTILALSLLCKISAKKIKGNRNTLKDMKTKSPYDRSSFNIMENDVLLRDPKVQLSLFSKKHYD